jgi:hypothetical protein
MSSFAHVENMGASIFAFKVLLHCKTQAVKARYVKDWGRSSHNSLNFAAAQRGARQGLNRWTGKPKPTAGERMWGYPEWP